MAEELNAPVPSVSCAPEQDEVAGYSFFGGLFSEPLAPVIAITVKAALLESKLDQLIQEAGE
jgi:hypothetical protein